MIVGETPSRTRLLIGDKFCTALEWMDLIKPDFIFTYLFKSNGGYIGICRHETIIFMPKEEQIFHLQTGPTTEVFHLDFVLHILVHIQNACIMKVEHCVHIPNYSYVIAMSTGRSTECQETFYV